MTLRFHPLSTDIEPPVRFNDPFDYEPHQLCIMAASLVRAYIKKVGLHEEGKMLGVLVCRQCDGQLGFLAAYSGLLAGRNDWEWFVPPVFDAQQPDGHFKTTERAISSINAEVRVLSDSAVNGVLSSETAAQIQVLKQQRKQMSEELQLWLFRQYRMLNARGEEKDLVELWRDYHQSERIRRKYPLPPGGTGDCCAPKLLQYAYQQGLQPLCMAEFWQGESPRGEIRHEGHYYPACRGKCKPVLEWMLQGLDVETVPATRLDTDTLQPEILYEDSQIAVVVKPAGLLAVPGRTGEPSVAYLLRQRYPKAEGPLIVHRLDMDTSGLMVIALTNEAYHDLQRQFLERSVSKRYVALLQSSSCMSRLRSNPQGIISLPMLPDPLDRPRQVVDLEHGKQAVTRYELLSDALPHPRVALIPLTGRTHQLRVHCAHPDGLDCPILGDPLYGERAERLYLHAEQLSFRHPSTGETLTFSSPSPF
ncbi:MAG: RluA family pseudouridine synthase [Prevotella sp.]|nr:RluA family pseudouridine synthase [Prevotella sp.]